MAVRIHQEHPHVALLPSAGMGHLMPFLRLASALATHGCQVTFIAAKPAVSDAESSHLSALFSSHPQVHALEFPVVTFGATAKEVGLPSYILFTSSARMLTLFAYLPTTTIATTNRIGDVSIPGLPPLPSSMIPPALHDPANLFTRQFFDNGRALLHANKIIVNTFENLEKEALAALNGGAVVHGLPPVVAVGPLPALPPPPPPPTSTTTMLAWLDGQPARSVVYISFGSRTALSKVQSKELGLGLEKSGHKFLWVVKSRAVDKEEEAGLEELLSHGFLDRIRGKGLVVNNWVDQDVVLSHGSIGAFISHCGWNSVLESIAHGVRILAWPRGADQRVNSEIAERSGIGMWAREWGWSGDGEEEGLVRGEEIGELLGELMVNRRVGECVACVKEEAGRSVGVGGSSHVGIVGLIEEWKK
ncbi:UDP-glycosyltransferase CGT-like [Typha latifolia]|uniref:UDP-glycosyltransferase CGT-like n=1 Tax=Typha latifolia TaxID=4733 RepID=UPI003C2E6073